MKEKNSQSLPQLEDTKLCGCPVEEDCDHPISGFQKFCKQNPDAPECKIFDL